MRCAWMLILCAAAVSPWQLVGWAQEQAPEEQIAEESPSIRIDRLNRQLAELKKQRSGLIEKLVAEYRTRPESLQIVQQRDQARAALKAATDQALSRVREDPQYHKELAEKQEMEARVQRLRASAKPDPVQITQVATTYRQANLKLVQMEADAQDLDQQVTAARIRLASAEVAEADLQRRAQAYAILHGEYAALIVAIWQAETDLDRANADLRVAAALEHPEERQVARAPADDSVFWTGTLKRQAPMQTHETKGPRLADPLPIMPGTPVYPPIKGPMGVGRPYPVGNQ